MIEDNERQKVSGPIKIILVVLAFFVLIEIGNIISSSIAAGYGLTYNEMIEEFWLAALYIIVGAVCLIIIGHTRWPRPVVFGGRLLMIVLTIALVRNQFAVSKELAGIKHDFAIAAGNCRVRGEELVCGKDLQRVLERRDAKLRELGVVVLNDWRVTTMHRDITTPHRAGAYLFIPF